MNQPASNMSQKLECVRLTTKHQHVHNKFLHSTVLSSSSGYSTQSISELDCHNTNNSTITEKSKSHLIYLYDNANDSNLTSRATTPISPNLHTSCNVFSDIQTSTPVNIYSIKQQMSICISNIEANQHDLMVSNLSSLKKINFNPGCNSSLQPIKNSIGSLVRKIDYDKDYCFKTIPVSYTNSSNKPHSLLPSFQKSNYNLPYWIQHSSALPDGIYKKTRVNWAGSALRLFGFLVKLFSCLKIFSIFKKPKKIKDLTSELTKIYQPATKIEIVAAEHKKIPTDIKEIPKVNGNSSQLSYSSNNLCDSYFDTDSNYFQFTDGVNYIASSPIYTPYCKPVVAEINNLVISKNENYENVSLEFSKSPNTKSSSLSSISAISNQSTQFGLNLNIQSSKYSTFLVCSPLIYENCNIGDSILSSICSSAKSGGYLSKIDMNKKQKIPVNQKFNEIHRNISVAGHKSTDFLKFVNKSKLRSVNEDFLCDKEVESYFNTTNKSVLLKVDSKILTTKPSYLVRHEKDKRLHRKNAMNRGLQRPKLRTFRRNNINIKEIVGAGVVTQCQFESYC